MKKEKNKKIFTILMLFTLITITIISLIIGYTDPKYHELSFLMKMVTPFFSEMTLLLFKIFNVSNVTIMLLSLCLAMLILPSMSKLFSKTVLLFAKAKIFVFILLSGNSPLPEDEELNLEYEKKYDRNYKKFFAYLKDRDIPIHCFLTFPLYSLYLSLVSYGCFGFPTTLCDVDSSFLWISNVYTFDLISFLLYLALFIFIIVKRIQKKKTLPLVVSLIAYGTTLISGIYFCFVYWMVFCLYLTFNLKGGKFNGKRKKNKHTA